MPAINADLCGSSVTRARSDSSLQPSGARPATVMPCAGSSPAMDRSRVLLPDPDAPVSATASPCRRSSVTSGRDPQVGRSHKGRPFPVGRSRYRRPDTTRRARDPPEVGKAPAEGQDRIGQREGDKQSDHSRRGSDPTLREQQAARQKRPHDRHGCDHRQEGARAALHPVQPGGVRAGHGIQGDKIVLPRGQSAGQDKRLSVADHVDQPAPKRLAAMLRAFGQGFGPPCERPQDSGGGRKVKTCNRDGNRASDQPVQHCDDHAMCDQPGRDGEDHPQHETVQRVHVGDHAGQHRLSAQPGQRPGIAS